MEGKIQCKNLNNNKNQTENQQPRAGSLDEDLTRENSVQDGDSGSEKENISGVSIASLRMLQPRLKLDLKQNYEYKPKR